MEVSGLLATGIINGNKTNFWRPGERLLVEIVHITAEGEGTVRINGKEMFALLETSTQIGEKFWVKVGDNSQGSLLLIREPDNQGDIYLVSQRSPQLYRAVAEILAFIYRLDKAKSEISSSNT